MFLGCFSKYDVGSLKVIDGIMGKYSCVDILKFYFEASAEKFSLVAYKIQQDNDPMRTSEYAKEYMSINNNDVLVWASQSPDLNRIKNLWAYIKLKLRGKCFSKKTSLIAYVFEIQEHIPIEFCEKLVKTMFDRINQVLRSKKIILTIKFIDRFFFYL
ncbi:Transposable element Tcb2 transposase [Cucumispora dikerogammari]|nr:Transposable element Tcb2 transposase [Cucumispora dikerogammari]